MRLILAVSLCASLYCEATLSADTRAPVYTTKGSAESGCPVYDVTDIILSIDLNKDGKLSQQEWTEVNAPPSSYQMIEKDKKGYILPEEFTAVAPPGNIDDNHDCKITLAEMKAMETKMGGMGAGGPSNGAPPAS